MVHRFVRDLEQNKSHEGAVVGSSHVPCGGLSFELLDVQIFCNYCGVAFAHRSCKLVGRIFSDVGDFILYTLKFGTLALPRIGIAFAPGESLLLTPEFGVELLKLFCWKHEYCSV